MWASAWLAGNCAPDDVLDAMQEWAPMHLVGAADPVIAHRTGLPWPDARDAETMSALKTVREAAGHDGSALRLVLPVPGDVRGLPPAGPFTAAAIITGEGLLVGNPGTEGVGLVPVRSGPDVLCWTIFGVDIPPRAEELGLGEAEFAMRTAMRDAADAMAAVQRVGTTEFDPRAALEEQFAENARHKLPDAVPTRALRILESADRVDAILAVAQRGSTATALTAAGADNIDGLLRPLYAAVRSARLAAIESCVRTATRELG